MSDKKYNYKDIKELNIDQLEKASGGTATKEELTETMIQMIRILKRDGMSKNDVLDFMNKAASDSFLKENLGLLRTEYIDFVSATYDSLIIE